MAAPIFGDQAQILALKMCHKPGRWTAERPGGEEVRLCRGRKHEGGRQPIERRPHAHHWGGWSVRTEYDGVRRWKAIRQCSGPLGCGKQRAISLQTGDAA